MWRTPPSQAYSLAGCGSVFHGPGVGWRAFSRSVQEDVEGDLPPPPESCQLCPRSPPTQSALGIAGFILRSFWCPPSSLEIRLFWNEGQHLKTSVQGNFTYEMVSCGFIPETVFNFCIPSNDLARSRLITGIQVMSVEWLNAPEGPYWSHPLSFQPSTWVPAEGRDSDSSSMAPDGQA